MRFLTLSLLLLTTLAIGCKSAETTVLNRHENDLFSIDQKESGFPITLKVPTHLKVWIEEEYYLRKNERGEIVPLVLGNGDRILTMRSDFELHDKVFFVDLRRPPAGSIRTEVALDPEEQYFKTIKGRVVDNTFRAVEDVVKQYAPIFAAPTHASDGIKAELITAKRTLAFGRFDIDDPNFEAQLEAFITQHVNQCHNCDKWSTTAGSTTLRPTLPPTPIPAERAAEITRPSILNRE